MQTPTSHHTLKLNHKALEHIHHELETMFGDLTIHPRMSSEEIMYQAGQKSVVEYVKQKLEEE